jgi:hypothetical protein
VSLGSARVPVLGLRAVEDVDPGGESAGRSPPHPGGGRRRHGAARLGPVAPRIRDEATDGLDDRVAVERFEGKGGRFVRGEGRIVAPGRVAVDDRIIEARRGVVVATGTHAAIPPIPGWWPTGRRGPRCGGDIRIGAWRTSGVS